jgi:hypothetical protein
VRSVYARNASLVCMRECELLSWRCWRQEFTGSILFTSGKGCDACSAGEGRGQVSALRGSEAIRRTRVCRTGRQKSVNPNVYPRWVGQRGEVQRSAFYVGNVSCASVCMQSMSMTCQLISMQYAACSIIKASPETQDAEWSFFLGVLVMFEFML